MTDRFEEMYHRFEMDLEQEKDFIIWGTGKKCRELLDMCQGKISVKYCVDRDIQTESYIGGILIRDISALWDEDCHSCIIIASQAYPQIKAEMLAHGIREDRIYIYTEWEMLYFWLKEKRLVLPSVNLVTGNLCNLKCEGCIAYVPYSVIKRNIGFEEFESTIDNFFRYVDYVGSIYFGGGEVLLNKAVISIIAYLGEWYHNKIGRMYIITNGTLIPGDEWLTVCKKYSVDFVISDYSACISAEYKNVVKKLEEGGIGYIVEDDFVRNDEVNMWYDMGNPTKERHLDEAQLRRLFAACVPTCRCLYDNKIWYCSSLLYANLGLGLPMAAEDYFDLSVPKDKAEESVKSLLRTFLGYPHKGYYNMCDKCNGMGYDANKKLILAARQIR